MKRTFITLIMTMLLGIACNGATSNATLVIEIIEFNCTDHPVLFEKYNDAIIPKVEAKASELNFEDAGSLLFDSHLRADPKTVGFNFSDSLAGREKVLSEIEKVADKTIFLNHSQTIVVGENIDLVTELQDYEFKLKASTEAEDNNLINITLDSSISVEEYGKRGVNTDFTIERGQTLLMGGGATVQTTENENGETKETKTVWVMRFSIK